MVSANAHSSVISTLRILEMDALTVETADHRLTGTQVRAAIGADGDPWSIAAVVARSVHKQEASYLDVIHDKPSEWNPTDYAYHLTRRARGLPLWFSLSVHGVRAYSRAIETAIALAADTAAEIRTRGYLELIREPDLSVVLFRRLGWTPGQYAQWADQLLADQVAFIPPSSWEGETVARFAFLHPHTPMDLVREILDRMA